jgi:hypothetical protein
VAVLCEVDGEHTEYFGKQSRGQWWTYLDTDTTPNVCATGVSFL